MRVLLIEDEDSVRSSIADLLTVSGFTVTDAENGEIGLQKALAQQPDCIICDIMMPGLDGYDVISVLRAHPKTEDTPIIALSAKVEKTAKTKAIDLGANRYITKPYKSSNLVDAIHDTKSTNTPNPTIDHLLARLAHIHELIRGNNARIYTSILWEYASQIISMIRNQHGQVEAQS